MKRIVCLLAALLALFAFGTALAAPLTYETVGVVLDAPENGGDLVCTPYAVNENGYAMLSFRFADEAALAPVYEKIASLGAEDLADYLPEYEAALSAHSALLAIVVAIEDPYLATVKEALGLEALGYKELPAAGNGFTYFAATGKVPATLAEESRPAAEAALAETERMIASIRYVAVDTSERDALRAFAAEAFLNFETTDMQGNTVTGRELLGAKDLTVVNVWQTTCMPCINEMPELAAWAKEMPGNVQLVTILCDVMDPEDATFATAEKVLEKSGAAFTTLLLSDSLYPAIMDVTGTPTTMFLGKDGRSVHAPIVGANVAGYKKVVADFLAK
ncbi:MAG: TlpA disulfide reductase family protein [Clostridia bacterium]|nr:TlpA disulfide reductase family protein [Clostridia bacterium]